MCHPGIHCLKFIPVSGLILRRCGGRFSWQMGCSFRVWEFFAFITVTTKANEESRVVSGFSSLQFLDFRKLRGRADEIVCCFSCWIRLGGVFFLVEVFWCFSCWIRLGGVFLLVERSFWFRGKIEEARDVDVDDFFVFFRHFSTEPWAGFSDLKAQQEIMLAFWDL